MRLPVNPTSNSFKTANQLHFDNMRLAALLIALSFTSAASFAQVLYGTLTNAVGRQTTPMAPPAHSFSFKMFF